MVECNLCGRPATDRHHCLVGRSKKRPFLDHPLNLEPLCRKCHQSGYANSYDHRKEFFAEQVAVFGDDFLEWWHTLPLKVKPNYE